MDEYEYIMNLNTKAVVTLSKLVLPYLKETKGEIVNVSSVAGLNIAMPMYVYYSMAKAALDNFTRSMAIQYAKDGIRVNSVNPGAVSTSIMEKQGLSQEQIKQVEADISKKIPLQRPGQPSEIAHTIAFLCDRNACGYIIGQTIIVVTLVPHAFNSSELEDSMKKK